MTDRLANAQERAIKMMENTFKMCYQEGFDDCYKKVEEEKSKAVTTKEEVAKVEYERGLNDAWECIKKLYTMYTKGDITKIFNASFGSVLKNYSAQECITKIKKYEENKTVKVGDIVTVVGDIVVIGEKPNEFIVTWVGDYEVTLISRNGFHARTSRIDCLIKTGEHCDIEKCFKCTVF